MCARACVRACVSVPVCARACGRACARPSGCRCRYTWCRTCRATGIDPACTVSTARPCSQESIRTALRPCTRPGCTRTRARAHANVLTRISIRMYTRTLARTRSHLQAKKNGGSLSIVKTPCATACLRVYACVRVRVCARACVCVCRLVVDLERHIRSRPGPVPGLGVRERVVRVGQVRASLHTHTRSHGNAFRTCRAIRRHQISRSPGPGLSCAL